MVEVSKQTSHTSRHTSVNLHIHSMSLQYQKHVNTEKGVDFELEGYEFMHVDQKTKVGEE